MKELQKKFKPRTIKERMAYNMMMSMFVGQIVDYVKSEDPEKTKEAIETLIKRLMWIIQ